MPFNADNADLLWPINTEPPISKHTIACVFDKLGRKHTLDLSVVNWPNEGGCDYERVSVDRMYSESWENGSWERRLQEDDTRTLIVEFPKTGEIDAEIQNLLMADAVKRGFADKFEPVGE